MPQFYENSLLIVFDGNEQVCKFTKVDNKVLMRHQAECRRMK